MVSWYTPHCLFFKNEHINSDICSIYDIIDSVGCEILDINDLDQITPVLKVYMPPFIYKKQLIKGIYSCNFVDCVNKIYADAKDIFFSIESTMWCSYPKSKTADAYYTLYKNTDRESYFRKKNPNKSNIKLIPLQEADIVDDKLFRPLLFNKKEIDILFVTRFIKYKNIDIFIKALKHYEKQYGERLKVTFISYYSYTNYERKFNIPPIEQQNTINFLNENIPDWKEYITIYEDVSFLKMYKYYNKAKMYVFTSLFEGSNRSIREAVLCNTPVILFKDYNKYARGESQLITPEMGIMVDKFSEINLSDAIHEMMLNYKKYNPRKYYIKQMNRKIFIDTCLKSFSEYQDIIYENGKYNSIFENKKIINAIKDTYNISYYKYIYSKYPKLVNTIFTKNGSKLFDYYIKKFGQYVEH